MIAETKDSPTVWFAVLERAIRTRDIKLARDAEAELHRLGIAVSFSPSRCLLMQEHRDAS